MPTNKDTSSKIADCLYCESPVGSGHNGRSVDGLKESSLPSDLIVKKDIVFIITNPASDRAAWEDIVK